MSARFSTGLRNAISGTVGFVGALDKGIIEIRSGARPASADAADAGTLLGVATLNSGAFVPGSPTNGLTFAAAAGGTVSKTGTWSFVGLAAGVAGHFRFKGNAVDDGSLSTTLPRLDGTCAVSGGDLSITTVNITVGMPVTIDGFSYTTPAE